MNSTIKISKELRNIAQDLDKRIEAIAGERFGFLLVIFTDERGSYVSNIDRTEAIKELKELIRLWEEGMPDIPAHDYTG